MVIARDEGEALVYGAGHVEPIGRADEQRDALFASLDEIGTSLALVSVNQPGVLGLPEGEGPAVARDANDELLALCASSGGRVVGLATLPWLSPSAAVEELERVVALGMRGAMVCSNICGQAVDRPLFEPILEAASRLSAPLLLHPTLPLSAGHLNDYKGLLAAAGYLFDTSTAAARLILSGVPERLPELAVVLSHSGSLLPALAGRLDEEWRRGGLELPAGAEGPPSELLKWLYSDTAGGSTRAVEACISLLGANRVMFGSDYPFWNAEHAWSVFSALSLSREDREMIASETAVQLFGVSAASTSAEPDDVAPAGRE